MARRRDASEGVESIGGFVAFCAALALSTFVAGAQPASASEIDPPAGDRAAAQERWAEFRAAADGSEAEAAAFAAFRTLTLELGALELRDHAALLYAEAREAEEAASSARAGQLRGWAESLDRSPSAALREQALEVVESQPWRGDRVISSVVGELSQSLSTSEGRASLASANSALAAFVALVALVVFALATFARTLVLGAADLQRMVPAFLTPWQMRGLLLVLVLAPALYLAAPACAIVAALLVAAPHFGTRDRAVGVLLLALVSSVPMWLETSLEAARAARSVPDVRPAVIGLCDSACLEDLERASADGDDDATLALAWWSWREGLPESRADAAALLEGVDDAPHRAASIATLRGHLALAGDDRNGAATHYGRARELANGTEQIALTAFNLYRVNMLRDDTAAARAALREASSSNGALVNLNVEYTGRAQNRLVLPCPFAPEASFTRAPYLSERRPASIERTTAAIFAGPAALSSAPVVAAALALWLIVTWPLRRALRLSLPCRKCGTATSTAFSPDAARAGLCIACHELATDQRLSFTQRSARERRVESTHLLRLIATLTLGVAAPGAATIARGATLRGTLLLLVGAVGIVLWTPLAGDFATLLRPLGESEPHLSLMFGMWLHGLAALAAVIDGVIHFGRRH